MHWQSRLQPGNYHICRPCILKATLNQCLVARRTSACVHSMQRGSQGQGLSARAFLRIFQRRRIVALLCWTAPKWKPCPYLLWQLCCCCFVSLLWGIHLFLLAGNSMGCTKMVNTRRKLTDECFCAHKKHFNQDPTAGVAPALDV